MKINIIGNVFGIDGYSNHCRQLSNALYQLNSDVRLDTPLPPDWARHVNDAELNMITKEDRTADATIAITTPPFWRIAMGDKCKKFIGFCVWEGDKIPEYWIEYLMDERVSQVWVPSHHTRSAILFSGELANIDNEKLMNKIRIVPHGVDLSVFGTNYLAEDNEKFTFLCNKGWRGGWEDRGGVAYVLKAFTEEFSSKDNVKLILKLNPSYINMQTVLPELDKLDLPKDRPQIDINCGALPYKELRALYEKADVYVSAQRADAFDLGSAEAMACGLPAIVTGYGGQIEHVVENESGLFIKPKEMRKVQGDIMYEEVEWCIPDIDDLKKKMRWAFNNKEKCKEMGLNAVKFISNNFTWRMAAKKGLNFLND